MDVITVDEWKRAALSNTTASDTHHMQSLNTLCSMFQRHITPSEAAQAITNAHEPYAKQRQKNSDDDRITHFWALFICDAIRKLGSSHEILLQLLEEMASQPDAIATDSTVATSPAGANYWRDLPGMPWEIYEQALHYAQPNEHYPDEVDEEAKGFLEDGIENSYDSKDPIESQAWKVLLPASAIWLTIAGKRVFEICVDGDRERADGNRRRPWSLERWEEWKKQLARFERREDFDEEVRGSASEALGEMGRVEAEREV